MKSNRGRIAIAAAISTISFGSVASAQVDTYWDLDGATPGAGGTTVTGTWDKTIDNPDPDPDTPGTPNWNESANGDGTVVTWDDVTLRNAIFSAGTGATGASTITLAAGQSLGINTLTIQEGSIEFVQVSASKINFAGGASGALITIEPGAELRFNNNGTFIGQTAANHVLLKNNSTLTTLNPAATDSLLTGFSDIRIDTDASATINLPVAANDVSAYSAPIIGAGGTTTLVKAGPGDFRTQNLGNTFTKLSVTGGMFRPGNNAANLNWNESTLAGGAASIFGTIPSALMADNIRLDNNGAIGNVNNITLNANRGITVGDGIDPANDIGRLDTQNGVMTVLGPISGPGSLAVGVTNPASTGPTAGANSFQNMNISGTNTYAGRTLINAGSISVRNGAAIPDTSAVVVSSTLNVPTDFATRARGNGNLNIVNSETVGSIAGGRPETGFINISSGQTLTTGADNTNTTYSGRISQPSSTSTTTNIVKVGTGVWTLDTSAAPTGLPVAPGTPVDNFPFLGTTTINGGRIQSTKPINLQGYNTPGKIVVNAGAAVGVHAGSSNWTAADIDTLRANATFNSTPGSSAQLAIDTSNAGGTFTYASSMSGAHGLTKIGTGTLDLTGSNSYTGSTVVDAGTLLVNKMHAGSAVAVNAGTLRVRESSPGVGSGHPSGDDAFVSQPDGLSVANGAVVDITNNDIIIDYTGSSPVAAYEALVASGYNVTGDWQGDGIVSSIAANDGNYVVAIADNATLAAPFGTANGGPLFAGVDVDLDTILIKFTHRADINLDGLITPDDSAVFGGNYDENQPAVWATGDMNYDGIFTPDDAAIFGGAYDESLASLPEPGSLAALALLGLGLARRRRRLA